MNPKRLVYSYTALNCYDSICPHQFYRRWVTKDVPFVESEALRRGIAVHTAFEARLGSARSLPDGMQHWEPIAAAFDGYGATVETKLAVDESGQPVDFWDNNKARIRGKVDLAIIKDSTAYLADWKTGKVREHPFELEVGAMLLHAAHPQVTKILGNYVWLENNSLGQQYDLSATWQTWDKCQAIIGAIEADRAFEKRQGPLCRWCSVFDCENNRNEARKIP